MADVTKTINTDADLINEVGTIAGGGVPTTEPSLIAEQPTELLGTEGVALGQAPEVNTMTAAMEGLNVGLTTTPTGLGQVGQIADVTTGLEQLGAAPVAQLTPAGDYMTAPQGEVSAQSLATAATEELDKRGTVQYQLGELMSSLEEGKPMPPWASPQIRKVNAVMQSRGLGASSMASAAITQSLMESGVQIAAADANKYAGIQLQNLNNRQQTALQNAATYAAMDKANLNARLQAAVTNAQAFLSVDLKNLDNQQKSDTLTYQSLVAGLFKDAAEENARREFNAKNELQVEEFFAELGVQVETANANREASMRQFNVSESNSMAQYNATMKDSREKFNSNMKFAIDQSNAIWRRNINTANTATQNESNRMDVQLQYNATQTALNALWQSYRDTAAWNFQKSENQLQREHAVGMAAMEFANTKELFDMQNKEEFARSIGAFITDLFMRD
jgi:hypothetical protein